MPEPFSIDPIANGPLKVSGAVHLVDPGGEPVATEAQFWLCRCGRSGKKPFCDGTHKKIGFSSARQSDPAARATVVYAGKHITVHDNRPICAHAGHCTEHSPKVFRMGVEPWIDADADDGSTTAATVRMCPSGALEYSRGGTMHKHSGRTPAIHITKDGPYAVVGGPLLKGDAAPVSDEHYTLCRCGHSQNKPFCDGSHWAAGFKDEQN